MATQITSQDIASASVTSTHLATGAVTASALDSTLPIYKNYIINGGMEVWQRGTSFSNPLSGACTSDRWQVNNNGNTATFTIAKETTITDASPASLKWTLSATGGTTVFGIVTRLEGIQLAGKTVTASIRVRVDAGGAGFAQAAISDANGTTSGTNTLLSGAATWETITATRTLASNSGAILDVKVNFNNSAGTAYIDNATLVVGSVATSYLPEDPQIELARCQRYFRVLGGVATKTIGSGQAYSTVNAEIPHNYVVSMRTTPTVTINNPTHFSMTKADATLQACTSFSASQLTAENFVLETIVASGLVAGNATQMTTTNADATIFLSAEI